VKWSCLLYEKVSFLDTCKQRAFLYEKSEFFTHVNKEPFYMQKVEFLDTCKRWAFLYEKSKVFLYT
jgi:diphthamide synthase (EF-2-diphthine--ammonia ligase)